MHGGADGPRPFALRQTAQGTGGKQLRQQGTRFTNWNQEADKSGRSAQLQKQPAQHKLGIDQPVCALRQRQRSDMPKEIAGFLSARPLRNIPAGAALIIDRHGVKRRAQPTIGFLIAHASRN